jgi:hypothetical protein
MTDTERAAMYSHEHWRKALEPLWGSEEADRLWIEANQRRRDVNAKLVQIELDAIARRTRIA